MESPGRVFLDYSARKLRQLAERVEDCLGRLTEEQIWVRHGDNQNAVGNLVLHLSGNVRQWIVSGVGGLPDTRQRDSEFAARSAPGENLARLFRETMAEAVGVIESVAPDRLGDGLLVQGYDITVLEAIYAVVEHFSGHTGQIVYATKLLTGEELGYYRYLNSPAAHARRTP